MVRVRRIGAAALISSLLVFGSVGAASAAGSPKAHFTFSICQTLVDTFDGDGNPIQLPGIETLYSWSGAYVDNVQGSWTRTDGEPVLFGFVDTDFTAGTSGSVDAGALIILDDTGFDGIAGAFAVHRHVIFSQVISEPADGWTSVPACL
jgi:hypothetical protein